MVKMIPKYTDETMRSKDIPIYQLPDYFILTPKLIISLESFGTEHKHWHLLSSEITSSIDKARKSYIHMLPEACIFYSILALEYALKTKYCLLTSNRAGEDEADKLLVDKSFNLGTFVKPGDTKLKEMRLLRLKKDITRLKSLRNGLIHFNYEELMKAIKDLGYDFSWHEKNGAFVFYTTFIDDNLALNVYKKTCGIIEEIFVRKKHRRKLSVSSSVRRVPRSHN